MKSILFLKSFLITMLFLTVFFLIAGCGNKEDESKMQITTSSEEARAEFLKGRELFEKLRGQESRIHFENAIAKDNNFAMAYYYHSLSSPSAKEFFADLEKMTSLVDNVTEGEKLFILALKSGNEGNQKKQEEQLKKLVGLYPNDERAQNQIGQFYFGLQKYQLAVDHLQKATEINPDFSLAYNMLGYSYRNLGDYVNAEKAFLKYIDIIPDDPNPYDSYAELLMKEGKYEASIGQYKKALSVNSKFVNSFVGIATNYGFLKKYQSARTECDKLYKIARNNGEKRFALFTKVVSYVSEGKTDSALTEMQKQYAIAEALNDAGNMTADLNTMGNILFEAGEYDKAKEKYDSALQTAVNSNLPDKVKENNQRFYLYNVARISLMKGNVDDAKSTAKEFSEKSMAANNTFQVWLSHELNGLIALNQKDYRKARDEFMQANQQNPYTFYRIALTYDGENNKTEAKKYYDKSVEFNALNNLNQAFVMNKVKNMPEIM